MDHKGLFGNKEIKSILVMSHLLNVYALLNRSKVSTLKSMCMKKLTEKQKTMIITHYKNQLPDVYDIILKKIKHNFNHVLFDIKWLGRSIRKNNVSHLILKFPDSFTNKNVE